MCPKLGWCVANFGAPLGSWCSGWLPIQSASNPICAAVPKKRPKYSILFFSWFFGCPKQGSCQFLCSGPKNASPKSKKIYSCRAKTGVDVNFCAAVLKMRPPKLKKILFLSCPKQGSVKFCVSGRIFGTPNIQKSYSCRTQNMGHVNFCAGDTFWDPK